MNERELAFLRKHEVCRLATASKDLMPHVIPAIYAMDGEKLVIAIDYGTRKLRNLRENPKVSVVVDDYRPNKAVFIQGTADVLENGPEYLRLLGILFERFEAYRKNPWGEGEAPIISITPQKIVSWGAL